MAHILSRRIVLPVTTCLFLVIIFSFFSISCSFQNPTVTHTDWCIFDVQQGLALGIIRDNRMVAIDLGDSSEYRRWRIGYEIAGSPEITDIVITHAHADHAGGLSKLDVPFSGAVFVGVFTDTAELRARSCYTYRDVMCFTVLKAGDTALFSNGTRGVCLWPPVDLDTARECARCGLNALSVVLKFTEGNRSILTTGDIDSSIMRRIAEREEANLRCDLLVVPHHGSQGSLCPSFDAWARPQIAAVSCGLRNDYGHPSGLVLRELGIGVGAEVFETRYGESGFWETNGTTLRRLYPSVIRPLPFFLD